MTKNGDAIINWGIIGAGIIAEKLADAVQNHQESRLAAVASKSPERAQTFAAKFDIPKALSYDEIVADPEVDIIYVATTHNYHYDNAKLALKAGKPVLMEKPFTVNAAEAEGLAEIARSKGLFLMEAIWVRFLPSLIKLKGFLADGAIGEVKQLVATFGNFVPPHFEERLNNPDLAGGVTLDMGIYPISFTSYVLGEIPQEVRSLARFSERGVDELANYLFRFPSGCMAQISTSFNLKMESAIRIYGSTGYIDCSPFPMASEIRIHRHNGTNEVADTEVIRVDQAENGFIYQVAESVRCLRSGEWESPIIPVDETVALMRVMDGMRLEWGFTYPFE